MSSKPTWGKLSNHTYLQNPIPHLKVPQEAQQLYIEMQSVA